MTLSSVQGGEVASRDSVRAVLDAVLAHPDYQWKEPHDPFAVLRRGWNALLDWLFDLQARDPETFRLVFWGLIVLLALILLHAGWITYRTIRGATALEHHERRDPRVPRDAAWYAREARDLAAAGRFAEAIQADFTRLILELDEVKLVRFHPARTPAEYTREPTLGEEGRRALRDLVRLVYRYAFARAACGPAEYDEWRAVARADRFARLAGQDATGSPQYAPSY